MQKSNKKPYKPSSAADSKGVESNNRIRKDRKAPKRERDNKPTHKDRSIMDLSRAIRTKSTKASDAVSSSLRNLKIGSFSLEEAETRKVEISKAIKKVRQLRHDLIFLKDKLLNTLEKLPTEQLVEFYRTREEADRGEMEISTFISIMTAQLEYVNALQRHSEKSSSENKNDSKMTTNDTNMTLDDFEKEYELTNEDMNLLDKSD